MYILAETCGQFCIVNKLLCLDWIYRTSDYAKYIYIFMSNGVVYTNTFRNRNTRPNARTKKITDSKIQPGTRLIMQIISMKKANC
jgi:hypothetical protein